MGLCGLGCDCYYRDSFNNIVLKNFGDNAKVSFAGLFGLFIIRKIRKLFS